MTNTASEPDPHAGQRARDGAAVADALANGGDRSAAGRGELLLLVAGERDDRRAIPDRGAALSPERLGRSSGASAPARRLRLAPPVQLELVCEREGPRPEVLWASLPERTREAVLVVLARLIGAGAVEEQDGV